MAASARDRDRAPVAGNLPSTRSSTFVGRKLLLGRARKDLAATRLITLTGVGGVGKTRLALQLARGVARSFADGVWLVDLTPHPDADLVTAAVAATLGLHDSSESAIRETLVAHLRTRTALLVLDNCEHVIDGVASTVAAVLDAAPDVRILLTSREPLGLEDERVIEVPPLAIPPANPSDPLAALDAMDYDAARLLVARAEDAGRPDFAATADPALVARLCQRLDGIPLAIVLAAARLYSMSLADVVARVDDQFALLNRGGRGMQDHHQTLWDCIAWSYELCTPTCRVLWTRLSVFTGPFRLDDAVAVCADDAAGTIGVHAVVDLLDDLVRQSVVTRVLQPDGDTRYRLLDPLRGYGSVQLTEAGDVRWRRRHAGHYRHLAVRAAAERFSPRHVQVVATIRRELPNLRAALEWCVERPAESETALALVVALSQAAAWFTSATVAEGRRYLDRALDLPDRTPSLVRVQAAMYGAWFAVLQSDPAATAKVRRCRDEAARLGGDDPLSLPMAYASYAAGLDLLFGSSDPCSITELDRATAGFRRADVPGMTHLASLYLALAGLRFHERDVADAASGECLVNAERHGDATAISWARWTRGLAELDMGDVAPARERFRLSLRAQRDLGTYWGTEWIVESLAWCAAVDGQPEFAARLLGAAASLRTVAGRDGVGLASFRDSHVEASRLVEAAKLEQGIFEAAYRSGADCGYQDAIALALGEPPAASRPARRAQLSLTRRQRDVAALVAQGMTSRDIAARLYISRRTVETHLAKIMTVLNVRTRVEVATWWSSQDTAR
ncbi:MAG TPA: LuxR C-terminal-related transcriptional regulator [Pseudonocardiaceae bacterium]|nr:LuxR C-terminal-related transcriptional regulator [Pseudonocardiaceae bacterium]